MNSVDQIVVNFEETRQRSLEIWLNISTELLFWKPTANERSILEMIRHVLEVEHLLHETIRKQGRLRYYYESPWKGLGYWDLETELQFASHFREHFIDDIKYFTPAELCDLSVKRPEFGKTRPLGDCLTRMVSHETRHAEKLLNCLKSYGAGKTTFWRLV